MMIAKFIGVALAALSLGAAAPSLDPPAWTKPIPARQIISNIYYVGTEGLAAYLIVTPKGLILLDAGMVTTGYGSMIAFFAGMGPGYRCAIPG